MHLVTNKPGARPGVSAGAFGHQEKGTGPTNRRGIGQNDAIDEHDIDHASRGGSHPQSPGDDRSRDAGLVESALAGDGESFGKLYDFWFDRVFNLALRVTHDHDRARDATQETFLAAWRALPDLRDHMAFGGWLLRIARNAALNQSEREQRSQPVDQEGLAVIEHGGHSPSSAPAGFGVESRLASAHDPEAAAADGEIVSLVHETVAALGERDAEVLDLQLRYQLSPAEIGEVLGLNRNAANQLCHRVRSRFAEAFGVRMLWSGSQAACPELRGLLASTGDQRFGAGSVRVASRHAETCPYCDDRRQTRISPAALFSAIPLVPVALSIKAEVAAALTAAGVPMAGSPTASWSPGQHLSNGVGRVVRRFGPQPALMAAAVVAIVMATAGLSAIFASGGDDDPTPQAASASLDRDASTTPDGSPVSVAADDDPTKALVTPKDLSPPPGSVLAPAPIPAPSTVTTPGAEAAPPATGGEPVHGPTTTAPPATSPPSSSTSTQPPAPLPTIETLSLAPDGVQVSPYSMGRTAPRLSWSVSDASMVSVWVWFDDGSGPIRHRVLATDSAGAVAVCPGTIDPGGACAAPPGVYSFTIEATSADGVTVTSDLNNPPAFAVRVVILR